VQGLHQVILHMCPGLSQTHGDGRIDMSVRPSVMFDKALVYPLRNI
jgi:hypothetical protein